MKMPKIIQISNIIFHRSLLQCDSVKIAFSLFHLLRSHHVYVHVHAKSTLRSVRIDGAQLSITTGWNALICLNMHAVEVRCGDTGQINQ